MMRQQVGTPVLLMEMVMLLLEALACQKVVVQVRGAS